MYILGVSAFYHDSAAVLIKDGAIRCAVQEERFTRIKQDSSFPKEAISYCLDYEGIGINEIDAFVFYDDPSLKYKRIIKTYVDFFPKTIPLMAKTIPSWLGGKLYWKNLLRKNIKESFGYEFPKDKIFNTTHHHSHAASAFYPSPFENSAVLVIDGVGEFDTISIWSGQDNSLKKIKSIRFPSSLGLLYSAITNYLGFKVNSGEYKVMGLAPYGEPKYTQAIKNCLIKSSGVQDFELDMKYFEFPYSYRMFNDHFCEVFGQPKRAPESDLTQFHMDVARSIQDVTEDVVMSLAQEAIELTGSANLCMAGGVALNCVANGKLLRSGIAEGDLWIQPAAGDAGGALGAAMSYWYEVLGHERKIGSSDDQMSGSYLGPAFEAEQIADYLDSVDAVYEKVPNVEELCDKVAAELADAKVVGWHQGRMEYGPRSLGNRSILGDPRSEDMQTTMNLKIKYRESFRPFAPSVLAEDVQNYFDLDTISPYMLLVAPVKQELRKAMTQEEQELFGISKLNVVRSEIPAVTHVDYSARVQTVSEAKNERYYKLLKSFKGKTGCSVLINTSFNVRGEPVVCSPEDSYRCFMRTEMDVLVIGDYVLYKKDQPVREDDESWKEEFVLD
jgi:carbamoyltransferase